MPFTENHPSVVNYTHRPRTNLDNWKGKLPAATWNHLARARGAHLNSMEVFPLFAAAMVWSTSPLRVVEVAKLMMLTGCRKRRQAAASGSEQRSGDIFRIQDAVLCDVHRDLQQHFGVCEDSSVLVVDCHTHHGVVACGESSICDGSLTSLIFEADIGLGV